jgi:hypothetical protein
MVMFSSSFVKQFNGRPFLAALLIAVVGHSAIDHSTKSQKQIKVASAIPIAKLHQFPAVEVAQTSRILVASAQPVAKLTQAQTNQVAPQTSKILDEKTALDSVWKLRQVQRKAREIERLSKGSIRLAAAVDSSPTEDAPYYLVRVFENHRDKSTHTIYWFRVLSPSGAIEALDLIKNEYIPLNKWNPDARR